MIRFDPANLHLVSCEIAKRSIQSGWIGQYRGAGYLSRAIQYATSSVHSHSAMFRRRSDGEIDVLEMREFKGGQTKTLEHHAAESPGLIDVFACNAGIRWHYDQRLAVDMMRWLVDRKYGYSAVASLGLRKVPGLWRLFPITNLDAEMGKARPFCSQAVALATIAGGVDPVPNCPSYLVTPGDLTKSLFFEYQFTIAGETH